MSSCVLLNFYILTMINYWHQIELMSRVYFNHLYFFIFFIWKYLQNISHSLSYLPGTHITFENIIFISLQCNCFTAWLPLLVIVEKSFFVPFDLFSLCYFMLGRGLRRSPGVVSVLRSSHKVWSWSWQAAEWIALSSNWMDTGCMLGHKLSSSPLTPRSHWSWRSCSLRRCWRRWWRRRDWSWARRPARFWGHTVVTQIIDIESDPQQ